MFSATNYDYTTVEEFLPLYVAVLNNIKDNEAKVAEMFPASCSRRRMGRSTASEPRDANGRARVERARHVR